MGAWRAVEGLTETGDFIALSGGSSWTGRPISLWFKGAPVVDVMNGMGYDGMTIGNLDFHFGTSQLTQRAAEANFPLLASNIRLQASGGVPAYAEPFAVKTVNGLRVGLIGLTPLSTPEDNVPANTEGLEFRPYAEALSESVPLARAAGAQVILVVAHLCYEDITLLLPQARQLGISMIAGSFCGQTKAEVSDGVAVVVPRWGFAEYGKVTIRVNESSKAVLGIQAEIKPGTGAWEPDEEVEAKVQHWQGQMQADLAAVVGHVTAQLQKESIPLQNFVMDSWLNNYPADIAILNAGAIRAGLPAGDITKGAVVNMLPFENKLVEVRLTGAEVIECLQTGMILAGMRTVGGYFHSDGTALKMDSVYHVLTTDFLYGQGNTNFSNFDGTPKSTDILYYQPPLAYLEALATSPENPLDLFLDATPRR
jgi:2',3'-cyclic-nucleotide 2'-phosphodiesterase (5'-nucleotidase family)